MATEPEIKKRRFASMTEEEIEKEAADLQNSNTLKAEKKIEKILQSYLSELGEILI